MSAYMLQAMSHGLELRPNRAKMKTMITLRLMCLEQMSESNDDRFDARSESLPLASKNCLQNKAKKHIYRIPFFILEYAKN